MNRFLGDGPSQIGSSAIPEARTYGRAALLLVESLMHSLLEKGVISRDDFIETVEGAAEVEQELAAANASLPSDSSGSVLYSLAHAFRTELGR